MLDIPAGTQQVLVVVVEEGETKLSVFTTVIAQERLYGWNQSHYAVGKNNGPSQCLQKSAAKSR